MRKRVSKPVVQSEHDSDEDDVPLAQLRSSSAKKPSRVLRKRVAKPVQSEHDSDEDDVPLAQLRSSSAKPVVQSDHASVLGDFDSDDDIPLSRLVKSKVSWKRMKRCSFTCQLCANHFHSHHTMKGHLLKKHKHFPCRTTYCYATFITTSVRNAHEAVHTVRKYVCDECKRVFKHKSVRDRHRVCHEESQAFQCAECAKCYHRQQDLKQHVKQHHRVKNAAKFHCSDCKAVFATARQLGYHRKTHLPKSIPCPHCSKLFRHYQQRKRHVAQMHQ